MRDQSATGALERQHNGGMNLRTAADRNPLAFDAAVAAAVMAACALVLTGRTGASVTEAHLVDWLEVVVLPVPLIWRRRAPVVVFWAVAVLILGFDHLGGAAPLSPLVPLVALHAVARYRPLRYVWPAVALLLLTGLMARLAGDVPWGGVVAIAAVVLATTLLGTNQRTWRAYLAEVEERAARLERERDQQAALAVAGERARIAREMHDVVAHHLTVMVALADGAAATAAAAPARAVGVMEQVSATGRQALGEMRRLVGLLRGGTGDDPGGQRLDGAGRAPQPGFDDIDRLVEQVRAAGVRVSLVRDGTPGLWGPGAGLAVYRIVQEALTNTLKHAGPHAVASVRLRYGANSAEVEVDDDGAGRPARAAAPPDRHGLAGMIERATSYGGHVEAGPRPGAGWQVRAHLEFSAAGAAAP
jgi:signal transduction histidine kinase